MKLGRAMAVLSVVTGGLIAFLGASASADTTYYPEQSNAQRVYLSRACHGANGSANCNTNQGCDGYLENSGSKILADALKSSLLVRDYPVRVGNNGVNANVQSSNQWGAKIHMPLHSNAQRGSCPGNARQGEKGTLVFYGGDRASQLGTQIIRQIRGYSPGTNDGTRFTDGLGEINNSNAVIPYMETEFHDWVRGVNFLRNESTVAYAIAQGIDACRGGPRAGQGLTRNKACTW